jgi:hypothetical protein
MVNCQKLVLVNDMDETLTHEEKELIKRALRGLTIAFIALMLTRNVSQVELPVWQFSLCLGLMSCFNSLFGFVRVILCVLAIEVLFPVALLTSLVSHF